jgi:glycosyltransferase involved in cell wall biosynthesis
MSDKRPLVLFPGRVVRDKGVSEFVEAAMVLHQRHPDWRFVVAGSADYDNPSAIPSEEIANWRATGAVEFTGHVPDIAPLMAAASIVCLPSYREGMPKALLDAAAWGCAVVTTDVPGCRDAIETNVTGLLVPARDVPALTEALERLILNSDRRAAFGIAGRNRAEREFALDKIVGRLLEIYE